jgi:gramicidin S synthase 2
MVPSYFTALDRIPLLPNGKVARKALPLPGEIERSNYAPPRNPVEQKLVDLWSEVLTIEKEKIGIDDNFFHLGGHSLRVTVMIAKVQKELHAQLPLKEIFQNPTIRGISALISAAEWVSNQEITAESESEKENEKKEIKRIVI